MKIDMSSAELNPIDIQGVIDVLKSGRLALGPKALAFEHAMTKYVDAKYAVAVNSGTSALHLIVKSLGIGDGDEVIVPSFTFAASVNALLYEKAVPVFVDIKEQTYNLDPDRIEELITEKTKAIMVVDVFGHPAQWDRILEIAAKHNLKIIDDSCEALGAEYKGKKLGTFGDASAFAFYPNKQMTTGEGGIIVTDNEEIYHLCKSYRNQGRDEMGTWLEHVRIGYNYRMDEMSASLGLSQLMQIDTFIDKRENAAMLYNKYLKNISGIQIPLIKDNVKHSWFVYVIRLTSGITRDNFIKKLEDADIPARGYFAPIHTQKYIQDYTFRYKSLPVTESVSNYTVALPFHNNITEEQIKYISQSIQNILNK